MAKGMTKTALVRFMAEKLETGMRLDMLHVTLGTGEQVVHAEYLMSLLQQAIDEVGSEEACASGHQNAFAAIIEARH